MQFMRNMLGEQRRRVLGAILGYSERNIYQHLPEQKQVAFRDAVIRAVTQYHDTCLDLLRSSINDGTVVNQDALEILARLDRNVLDMKALVEEDYEPERVISSDLG